MVEDLMAIVHVFSARLYGSRSYKQKVRSGKGSAENEV